MSEKIIENYEQEAADYEIDRFGSPGGKTINRIQLEIVRKMVEPKGKKILDIACGTGRFTADMSEHGGNVIGADAAENMLKIARKKNPGIKFEKADIFKLKYRDRTFDAVTGFKIIMHLYEYEKALKEMKRVVKDNGFIVFEVPNKASILSLLMNIRKKIFYKEAHEHKVKKPDFTFDSIKKDLKKLGLKIEKKKGMTYLPETLFRKSPKIFLPCLYRAERFLSAILPARWAGIIFLKVCKINHHG